MCHFGCEYTFVGCQHIGPIRWLNIVVSKNFLEANILAAQQNFQHRKNPSWGTQIDKKLSLIGMDDAESDRIWFCKKMFTNPNWTIFMFFVALFNFWNSSLQNVWCSIFFIYYIFSYNENERGHKIKVKKNFRIFSLFRILMQCNLALI